MSYKDAEPIKTHCRTLMDFIKISTRLVGCLFLIMFKRKLRLLNIMKINKDFPLPPIIPDLSNLAH